jgi:hypothetical protein
MASPAEARVWKEGYLTKQGETVPSWLLSHFPIFYQIEIAWLSTMIELSVPPCLGKCIHKPTPITVFVCLSIKPLYGCCDRNYFALGFIIPNPLSERCYKIAASV